MLFLSGVIAGLDPAIHFAKAMDARVKPAHDASRQLNATFTDDSGNSWPKQR